MTWFLTIEINKEIFFGVEIDLIKNFLRLLTVWLALFNFIVSPFSKNSTLYNWIISATIIILLFTFQTRSLLSFYFFFEISILPILFLILGWGYQPERISASFFIFFYTLFGSLPLLIILFFLLGEVFSTNVCIKLIYICGLRSSQSIILFGAFLIKLPIYYTHMWLPKAHVEAPVVGSIILAGLMLKLGGFGIILCLIYPLYIKGVFLVIIIISAVGGGLTRVMMRRLSDIKVIIAYSSVVHIRLISPSLISYSIIGVLGVLLIIISHGFTSPGLFFGANVIYERSHSRSIFLNKGLLRINSTLGSFWFLLIILNFGGPFTLNLLSEILIINMLRNISNFIFIWVGLACFFSLVYNLILYASLNQGVIINIIIITPTHPREILVLLGIISPAFLALISRQI